MNLVGNQLKEIAVERSDHCIIFPGQGIPCNPVIGLAAFSFPVGDFQVIQSLINIRQLVKGCFLRFLPIRPICLVAFVQFFSGIAAFSIKEHCHMGRRYLPDDLQQRPYKAQCSLDGLSLMIDDPGGHAIIHLK